MRQLLLLSNGTVSGKRFLEHAHSWITALYRASQSEPKRILFIPYAIGNYEAYTDKAQAALKDLGVQVISAHTSSEPRALLNNIDGIFVGGGNTFRLLYKLQTLDLLSSIKARVENGLPYMGASAGSNVASPTIQTTNDMPIIRPSSLEAMGLIPFQINPHYVDGALYYTAGSQTLPYSGETREERINEYHEENDLPVVGLREGTALQVVGSTVTLLGDGAARLFRRGVAPLEMISGEILSRLISEMSGSES